MMAAFDDSAWCAGRGPRSTTTTTRDRRVVVPPTIHQSISWNRCTSGRWPPSVIIMHHDHHNRFRACSGVCGLISSTPQAALEARTSCPSSSSVVFPPRVVLQRAVLVRACPVTDNMTMRASCFLLLRASLSPLAGAVAAGCWHRPRTPLPQSYHAKNND